MKHFIKQHGWFLAIGSLGLLLFAASSFYVVSNRESTIYAEREANAIHSLERFHRLLSEWHTLSEEVGVTESLSYYYPAFRVQRGQLRANTLTAGLTVEVDRQVQRALRQAKLPAASTAVAGLIPLQEAAQDVLRAGALLRESRASRLVEIQADWALSIRLLWLSFAVLVALVPLHLIRSTRNTPTPAPDPYPALSEQVRVQNQLPSVDALADHAEVGLAVLDRTGAIVSTNVALCELLGYDEEDLVGTHLADYFLSKSGEEALPSIAQHLVHRNGEELRARVSLTHVRDGEGAIAHTFVIVEDVTAQQVAEALTRQLNTEAETAQQIRESIVANVNHELRTPLTIIQGYIQVLKVEVDPSQAEFVTAIEQASKRLQRVVRNLLDFSSIANDDVAETVRPMDPRKVVSEALGPQRVLAQEKGIRLTFHTPLKPLQMAGHPAMVQRLVGHLVDNAIKFTERGYINVVLEETAEHVALHVRDTGQGMGADVMRRVTQPFVQGSLGAARTHEGTGLGLSIALGLAEQMNGSLHVDSQPGRGTTVSVLFPNAAAAAALPEHTQRHQAAA